MGNNITCSINCNYRTAAKLYTLETWFVSGLELYIPYKEVITNNNNNNNNNNKLLESSIRFSRIPLKVWLQLLSFKAC
jgi:hypothetical protein